MPHKAPALVDVQRPPYLLGVRPDSVNDCTPVQTFRRRYSDVIANEAQQGADGLWKVSIVEPAGLRQIGLMRLGKNPMPRNDVYLALAFGRIEADE